MISEVDHISYSVRDLDRSVAFYSQMFGFKVRRGFDSNAPLFGALTGRPDAHLRMVIMYLGNTELGLFEQIKPRSKRQQAEEAIEVGAASLILQSDNVRADYERLKSLGVFFRSGPTGGPDAGFLACQGVDPDGIIFELVERVPPVKPKA